MDTSSACYELREPSVIDETLIYNTIIEQGPKGEEGRLFKEQGVNYEKTTYLRLEFLDILKIDHLWMMTGLTKLQLCNNIIEVIENLEHLVNLKELDLSFNHIARIANLDKLVNLEVLTLFENRIEVIENLEPFTKLTVLSIGNNKIHDSQNVLYLRLFEPIRSLNLAGNPLCEMEHFYEYIYSYLPQLVYYEYKMITPEQREAAREVFEKELGVLEREEAELYAIEAKEKAAAEQEVANAIAYVEYLGGNKLFLAMFENDVDGRALLDMSEDIKEVYAEFMENYTVACKELHQFGLEQHIIREKEIAMYDSCIAVDKEEVLNQSRQVLEDFLDQKKDLFEKLRTILDTEEEDDAKIAQLSLEVQEISETFQDLSLKTWHDLMKRELYIFEVIEEANSNFELALTELVNQFVEGAQAQFTMMRTLQGSWNEVLLETSGKFLTNLTVALAAGKANEADYTPALLHLMSDREVLTNAITGSNDMHLLVIDQREDKLVSQIRGWLTGYLTNMVRHNVDRNRRTVTEINHFLDMQRAELDEIMSTPLGLLTLPKEVQDALQLS